MLDTLLAEIELYVDAYVNPEGVAWAAWQQKLLGLYESDLSILQGPVDRIVAQAFTKRQFEKKVTEALTAEVVEALATSARTVAKLLEPLLNRASPTVSAVASAVVSGLDLPALALWSGGATRTKIQDFLKTLILTLTRGGSSGRSSCSWR